MASTQSVAIPALGIAVNELAFLLECRSVFGKATRLVGLAGLHLNITSMLAGWRDNLHILETWWYATSQSAISDSRIQYPEEGR